MTTLYVDINSGTYSTEKPVVVEIPDLDSLEEFCNRSDRGRVNEVMAALDSQPRRSKQFQCSAVAYRKGQ